MLVRYVPVQELLSTFFPGIWNCYPIWHFLFLKKIPDTSASKVHKKLLLSVSSQKLEKFWFLNLIQAMNLWIFKYLCNECLSKEEEMNFWFFSDELFQKVKRISFFKCYGYYCCSKSLGNMTRLGCFYVTAISSWG